MAKKITIEGESLLKKLSDEWGGQNSGSTTQEIHGTQVPAGKEWGVNRGEVERFIKEYLENHDKTLARRIGYMRPSSTTDANTFYHIEGFASDADAAAYDGDPVGNAKLLIMDMTFPVPTVKSDSYTASLTGDKATSPNYVVKSGSDFEVNLRYQSIHIVAATSTSENYGAVGTLSIERSIDGGSSWSIMEKRSVRPSEIADTNYPISINLGKWLVSDRQNQMRCRVSFSYVDDSGASNIRSSSYLTYIVNSVNLHVDMATQWERPITVNSGMSQLALRFNVYGAVQKTLHVEVDGLAATSSWSGIFDGTYHGSTVDAYMTDTTATRILAHGVREVRSWLTCSDGDGGELQSDVTVNHVMVVNTQTDEADLTQPYLLLQEVKSTVPNFVQSTLCGYAVYSPNGESIPMALLLTNSSASILAGTQTEYYRIEKDAAPETKYELSLAVEIEQEAGETQAITLQSFLHATRKSEKAGVTETIDFLLESTGTGYQYIAVDNSAGYAPTAGSNFHLNPKVRNNTEANPARILNARNKNSVVESEWTGFKFGQLDGWLTDEKGDKMLRVPAGCKLNIRYNPLSQFLNAPSSSMTMEFDMCVRNVTNEEDPIVSLFEKLDNGNVIGLKMLAMTGTMTTQSNTSPLTTDFRWQEDERVHISINICDEITPNVILNGVGDGLTAEGNSKSGNIALIRVFINGNINREIRFDKTSAQEFCTGAMKNGGITIGQEGADIDIYGIRVWEMRSLTAQNVYQNYLSTIPDQEEKSRKKRENDIMTSRRVDIDKVRSIGKRVLVWHGDEPYHQNTNKVKGWWEFWQYDDDGNAIPELSGTLCKETKSLPAKRQGTTANTYYYSNIQTKTSDVETLIIVALSELHESITQGDITTEGDTSYIQLKGGCLGKNFPLPSESFKSYELRVVEGVQYVLVPDGWIDGNGKYRGPGYIVADGLPMAQKLVLKINYASSMQSHIVGVNKLYNDLHTSYCGKNALQEKTSGALVAKHLETFLFFTQSEGSDTAIYRGPATWGPGKMDKPTWGYVKSEFPNFCMIEGADNNNELTDMRVPFDDEVHGSDEKSKVYYSPSDEAWMYRLADGTSEKCIDWDGGRTYVGEDSQEYPHADIVDYIRKTWNFLFLHAPRIKYFDGSYEAFLQSDASKDVNHKYWCRSAGGNDAHDFKLKRYDFSDGAWVDAGLWNGMSYDTVNLLDADNDEYGTYAAYMSLSTNQKTDYSGIVNDTFKRAIVNHAKLHIGEYFVVNSLKFHYCFQNHFISGTDNCSKNTYFVLVPIKEGDEIKWKFELHQDDVDTVLATDNSGLQTKPYYVDRMHPYADSDKTKSNCLYEGVNNVLFNLCEEMWEESGELSEALRDILTLMASLNNTKKGSVESSVMKGVWGTLNKYIFDVQRYIPAMAYNEAARIRYEFPAMIGYTSDQRNVDPIEQSMGDQLQAELQYMKRRLVYMASYAAFGEFRPKPDGSTGLDDAGDSFAMVANALPNGEVPTFTFTLRPHQYLYPTAALAQSLVNHHVRVAPGEDYRLRITPTQSSDDGVTIYGVNYYRSLGNVGDNSYKPTQTFTLKGKRLTEFVAEPTRWYPTPETLSKNPDANYVEEATAGYLPAFRCNGVNINATRLSRLSLKGCTSTGGGSVNISLLMRLAELDLRGTDLTQVQMPETETLRSAILPSTLTTLSLKDQPNLEELVLDGGEKLTSVEVTGSPMADTQSLMETLYMQRKDNPLNDITLKNVDWNNVSADLLMWIAGTRNTLMNGRISMLPPSSDRWLSFSEVVKLIRLFGDIQTEPKEGEVPTDRLYIDYTKRNIGGVHIKGDKYIYHTGEHDVWSAAATNDVGNNVKVEGGREAITFTLVESSASVYAAITDSVTGRVNVKQTYPSTTYLTFTLRMNVTLTDDTTLSVTKKVGFHKRLPKVGDLAFADGSFDDEMDNSKTLVGAVVRRTKNSDTEYILDVLSKENATLKSSDGTLNTSSLAWGIYPDASAELGFPAEWYGNEEEDGVKKMSGLRSVIDTAMANITYSGIPDGKGGKDFRYINDVKYDAETDIIVSAGYGGSRYLDSNQDDGYAVTDGAAADFDGKVKTKIVVDHANAIINGYLGESYPNSLTELADAMQRLVAKMDADGVSNATRYRQLYFPAIYACYLYEPSVQSEEVLHEQYKTKNWFCPSLGLIARIYNFYYNSCGRVTYDEGGRVSADNANENPVSEAMLPLFANLAKRMGGMNMGFNMPNASDHWSVTEYNSYSAWSVYFGSGYVNNNIKAYGFVARAVAAFTFTL